MPHIVVTDRDGSTDTLEYKEGDVLMEVLRNRGYENIIALCGGVCACATCQVYIDEMWLPKLPEIQEAEDEMLQFSESYESNSRLSCQIELDASMDGLSLTIARLE